MRTPVAAAAALLSLCACGEDLPPCHASFSDVGEARAPCDAEIDREAGGCFAKAQICPNKQPVNFCDQRREVSYPPNSILLKNNGQQPLVVSSIELLGDVRCSFDYLVDPPVGSAIAPGKAMAIQATYLARDEGQDRVAFRITSNAENFPEMIVELCGRTIANDGEPGACGPPDGFQCGAPASNDVVTCE